jgi:hypothetical protein
MGVAFYSPSAEIVGVTPYISWFFDGMLASGFVWFINSVVEYWEGNRSGNQ